MTDLAETAAALVAPGKGVLAVDGDPAGLAARLAAAGAAPTEAGRRAYREMLVTTPGLAQQVSGVLLPGEALWQRLADGRPFPLALADAGLLAGVRADAGLAPLAGTAGESITEGLDGLLPRLREYAARGVRFAAWRAGLRIGPGTPSALAIRANAQALGRFAGACQAAGLVPVVEPGVHPGGSHSLGRCETVTSIVLLDVMDSLHEYGAGFAGVVLRAAMVRPGRDGVATASPADVAEATLGALNGVPPTLAGVTFRCGGQPAGAAAASLAAMQRPLQLWPLTFGFGGALTGPALAAWRGDPARRGAGQRALARAVAASAAAVGGYGSAEQDAAQPPRGQGQQHHGVGGEHAELRQHTGETGAVPGQLGEGVVTPRLRGDVSDPPHRR